MKILKFNKDGKPTMKRMFKIIQAICCLYYGTQQNEADRKAAIEYIFQIAHVMVDTNKHLHKDWINNILFLEKGLIKTNLLKNIDEIYKNKEV